MDDWGQSLARSPGKSAYKDIKHEPAKVLDSGLVAKQFNTWL